LSRLDSFIRRLTAQRDLLNQAARTIADLPGPVLELGLGNGRTYDHLRSILPGRPVYVFDRKVAAHPDSVPDAEHLFLGDFADTLPAAARRLGASAALAHCDIGSGDRAATAALARWLGPALAPLLAPGAIVLADQRLELPRAVALPQPDSVPPGRYHFYRIGE
jgi:hypothetical protein